LCEAKKASSLILPFVKLKDYIRLEVIKLVY
jgi:hypothetical protein